MYILLKKDSDMFETINDITKMLIDIGKIECIIEENDVEIKYCFDKKYIETLKRRV